MQLTWFFGFASSMLEVTSCLLFWFTLQTCTFSMLYPWPTTSLLKPLEGDTLLVMERTEALLTPSAVLDIWLLYLSFEGAWNSWGNSPCPQRRVHKLPEAHTGCSKSPKMAVCFGKKTSGAFSVMPTSHQILKGKAEASVPRALDVGLGCSGTADNCFLNL